jgi:nucleoside-diphosphate-sugar epimerase
LGVDNLNNAYDVRLKEYRLSRLAGRDGFTFCRGDIVDRSFVRSLWSGTVPINAVVNLAARAGVRSSVEDPWVYYETNLTGALNLLDACRECGVKKYVLASTSSVYGNSTARPYREDAPTDNPLSPYAASKKAAEALCYTYHLLHGLDITVLRYFTVYGPAGRPDMAPFRFVRWIAEGVPVTVFGDGTQERDFTFVDDIARGTIAALRPIGYEVVNLGCDSPTPVLDVIQLIERLVGRPARLVFEPRHPADAVATWASVDKAQRLLAWKPRVKPREGFAELVSWYHQHRDWARLITS